MAKNHLTYTRLLEAPTMGRKTPANLARLLNESEQTINNWRIRGIPKNIDKLFTIEDKTGASPRYIILGESQSKLTVQRNKFVADFEKLIRNMEDEDINRIIELCRAIAERNSMSK